jgi:hypothetical protein
LKVLIFGLPRTGSTILQKQLSTHLHLKNFNEPFSLFNLENQTSELEDVYTQLSKQTDYVIKLLTVHLEFVDFDKVLATGPFDLIVLVSRKKLVDCCVSLYYAQHVVQIYHYKHKPNLSTIQPFVCPIRFVEKWIQQYLEYQKIEKMLQDQPSVTTVYYEDYCTGISQKIANVDIDIKNNLCFESVATEIPYNILCSNYNEVKEKIIKELATW